MILKLLELLVTFFIIWTALTQIIVPFFRGTKIFPLFRKQNVLEEKLASKKQELHELGIEDEISKISRVCSTCTCTQNRVCMNEKSRFYKKSVFATDSCGEWSDQ